MVTWRWFQWWHVSHFDALCGEILPLAHQVVARDVGNWEFHPSLLRERLHDNYDDTGSRHIREHMLSGWWLWLSGVGGRRIIWIMKIMFTCNIATHAEGLIPPPLVTILIPCLDFKTLRWFLGQLSLSCNLPFDLPKMWSNGLDKIGGKSKLKEATSARRLE